MTLQNPQENKCECKKVKSGVCNFCINEAISRYEESKKRGTLDIDFPLICDWLKNAKTNEEGLMATTLPQDNLEKEKCVFCDIANRSGVEIVDIEPLNPVVKGHRIVFSARHSKDFTDNITATLYVMQRASKLAKEIGGDFNLITSKGKHSTQSVFHFHVHLVPRKENDGLQLPWTAKDI